VLTRTEASGGRIDFHNTSLSVARFSSVSLGLLADSVSLGLLAELGHELDGASLCGNKEAFKFGWRASLTLYQCDQPSTINMEYARLLLRGLIESIQGS